MSTALVEIRSAVEKMAPQFKAALPAHVPVERFVRTTLTAVQTNQALLDADRRYVDWADRLEQAMRPACARHLLGQDVLFDLRFDRGVAAADPDRVQIDHAV